MDLRLGICARKKATSDCVVGGVRVLGTVHSPFGSAQGRQEWLCCLRRTSAAVILSTMILVAPGKAGQQQGAYSIDGGASKVEIHVYKEGAFKMFGHDHLIAAKEISGEARFDPHKIEESKVNLKIATKSLSVVDPGESEKDRRDVQKTMEGPEVLDVKQFPEITFTSAKVSEGKKVADGWEVTVSGPLKLHGVEKTVSFPLHVHAEQGRVRGQGEVSIQQTDYGMTPVKAGGGTVKVKDRLKISFTIVAREGK